MKKARTVRIGGKKTRLQPIQRMRSSARWQKLRLHVLRQNPLCCNPFGDHGPKPAEEIHHVRGAAKNPELFFDANNLAPICIACHSKVSALEKTQDTTHFFLGVSD